MKLVITVCFHLLAFSVFSQNSNTDYLDMYLDVTRKGDAHYERYLEQIDEDVFKAEIKDLTGRLKAKGTYKQVEGELIPHGKFVFFHYNGQKESEGIFKMGYKVETWQRFMIDGTERPPKYYKSDLGNMIKELKQ
ncbi:MAG: hypothetical protein AB8B53_11125 [Flavobacteriales bacterium]